MFFKDIPKDVLDQLAGDAAGEAMEFWNTIMKDEVSFQFLMSMTCLAMYMSNKHGKDWWTRERILHEEIPDPNSEEIAEVRSKFIQFASGWAYLGKLFEAEKKWCEENIEKLDTLPSETDTIQ